MPQVETATQTHQENYDTALNGTYTINSKMSLDLAVNQNFSFADQFQSLPRMVNAGLAELSILGQVQCGSRRRDWGTTIWTTGPDMLFEQYQGRVQWRATDKISFQLNGGLEDRQFLNSSSSDALNPVFGGGIQYQPFEHTKISLNADRVVAVSDLQNQVTESVGLNGDLNQRLLGRLFLDLGGGYQNIKYVNSKRRSVPHPHGRLLLISIPASARPFSNAAPLPSSIRSAAIPPPQPGFGFTSHQVGFEIGFAY